MIATTAAAVAIFVAVAAEAADQTVAADVMPDLALAQPSYLTVADFAAVAAIVVAEVKAAAVDVPTFVVDVAVAADGAGAATGWQLAADFESWIVVAAAAFDSGQGPEPGQDWFEIGSMEVVGSWTVVASADCLGLESVLAVWCPHQADSVEVMPLTTH